MGNDISQEQVAETVSKLKGMSTEEKKAAQLQMEQVLNKHPILAFNYHLRNSVKGIPFGKIILSVFKKMSKEQLDKLNELNKLNKLGNFNWIANIVKEYVEQNKQIFEGGLENQIYRRGSFGRVKHRKSRSKRRRRRSRS
jgi:hypothetical protein